MVFSAPGILEKPRPSALRSEEPNAGPMILSPHHTAEMAQTLQHSLCLLFPPALKLNSSGSLRCHLRGFMQTVFISGGVILG